MKIKIPHQMCKQIILAFLLGLSISANSQVSVYGSAGMSSTGIHLSNTADSNISFENESYFQPFLTLGIAAPISNKLYWLGEVSYSPSGYQTTNNSTVSKLRYNMVNFQTGLGYQLGALRIEAGSFIGTSLTDKIKTGDSDWSRDFAYSEDYTIGAFVGLNLSLTKNIGIFARYYKGLSPISKISITDINGQVVNTLNEKINNLQFGITINLF